MWWRLFILVLVFILLPTSKAFAGSGFDFAVGRPDASGYYDAQRFGGTNDIMPGYHLGEDWNKSCSGDCDLGEPVFSINEGTVAQVAYLRVWGNVVTIVHDFNGHKYKSLYAHMRDVSVNPGVRVGLGQRIGSIGKGDRKIFAAHLHFELRDNLNLGIGSGYGTYKPTGWIDPTDFINSHRPVKAANLTATVTDGRANLSWTKAEDSRFERYEIYRSSVQGGTGEPGIRTVVATFTDSNNINTVDEKAPIGTTYYRLLTYFKGGLTAESAEVAVELKREVKTIASGAGYQASPTIVNGKVYYEDLTPNGNYNNKKLFYYDLKTGETDSVDIPFNMTYAFQPQGAGTKVAYSSYTSSGCDRVFYYDFESGINLPASIGDGVCSQVNPDISESGILVWQQLGPDKTYDVYFNDIKGANGPQKLTAAAGNQRNARVYGSTVVWKDGRNGGYDIYMRDISNGSEEKLVTNAGDGTADTWGDWLIWEYKTKITLLNLKTKAQKVIASSGGGYNPTINEGKVAYTLVESATSYVHIYGITTGQDTKIVVPLHSGSFPSYGDGYVAWDDTLAWPSTNKDVFLTKL